MLRTLYIENIAVIEKTSIDFENGLNVLTGETGAGKSIIIDAINAIMGQRTSKEIIRTEADSAFVSAQFDDINQSIVEKLDELGFSDDEGMLILQRTLNRNGKSSCKINGKPATVSMLKELSKHLINIHGQHESYELFSPETHIDYIDRFGGCEKLLADYKKCYDEYKILKKKLNSADSDESERLKEIDLLSYQVNELTESDVKQGEEQELESERTALMSFEKIFSLLNDAKMALDGDENYGGGLESVDSASTALQKASSYNAEYEEIANTLTDAYYNLKDCCDSISDAIDSLESDPQRLEEVEERLDLINRLTRKYNCPSDELSDLAEKCRESEEKMLAAAEKLGTLRRKAAKTFATKVKSEMAFLNMPNVELVPYFEKCEPNSKGTDKMELLISANPGETPRPVAKIASGGELSRMMLAIKTVLASTDTVDTLIFDEVDTGISGSAAEKVGLKLREVSKSSQVLCVTHQAQIAALADYHYLIRKQVEKGRTFTNVTLLDHNGRAGELARIIGGVDITDAALKHAESMLEKYNN